ncbi:histone deacetylase family protein [Methylocella silvestris]|uniref:Acetoin utilization protein n=1 Tax=Methylocella silvestris TaxID=199596 RepID=A0A2J7TK45_METSI|nr:histone deacetylase family protein [Methylocella silvestris]PNG27133.1 acetoin utilization protein [Methylocella silvestris]
MIERRSFLKLCLASAMTQTELLSGSAAAAGDASQTLLVTHPAFFDHDPGPGHPERPARLRAIDAALKDPAFSALRREAAPLRDDIETAILRAHSASHLARFKAAATDAGNLPYSFDGDTAISAGSFEAAYRAVGAGLFAVDLVMDPKSRVANAFCEVRPPGHHAERERIMGFCLFNNIAIAALYARARHGAERVAIIDFDVHHGNGTQQIFWEDSAVLFGSTHQMPLFPYSGAVTETGVDNIVNAPLRAGDGGAEFKEAMETRILPALHAFRPDLILISAGFDAHRGDPLARLRLDDEDFAWITLKLIEAAQKHCGGRIVSFLEGGYGLHALATSTAAHVGALMQGV